MYFPEGVFPSVIEDYNNHNQECESLKHIWLGRKGGVTSFGDTFTCETCSVIFYVEGFHMIEEDEGTEELWLCECHYREKIKTQK